MEPERKMCVQWRLRLDICFSSRATPAVREFQYSSGNEQVRWREVDNTHTHFLYNFFLSCMGGRRELQNQFNCHQSKKVSPQFFTSANNRPWGSSWSAIPWRMSSMNSSRRRNLMAHRDLQSRQYIPISSSLDLSRSIENLAIKG